MSCALAAAGLASLSPDVLSRLPEPAMTADDADAAHSDDLADKVAYRELALRSFLRLRLSALAAVAGGAVGWRLGWDPLAVAWVYLSAVGVLLAYVDAHTNLLPTRIIAPSYAVVIACIVGSAALTQDAQLLFRAAAGWAIMGGLYLLMWLVYPKGLGYGDVRLSGLLGAALGAASWGALGAGFYAGLLLGGVGGVALLLMRRSSRHSFPFGPYLLAGAFVGLIWGEPLAHWYTTV
ncbi:MAG: prepilin peptidase [Nocardioidaceae bacterium]